VETNRTGGLPPGRADSDAGPAFAPAFYKLDELADVALREGVSARFVEGGRMMLSFVQLEAGAEVPLHDHPHEQVGCMIEGSMYLTIGDEERLVKPGDAYTIPGGVPHRAVGGPEGGLALDVFSPPREDYLALARRAAGS
jgi:quercetin dioxygenase-like cupin family protein